MLVGLAQLAFRVIERSTSRVASSPSFVFFLMHQTAASASDYENSNQSLEAVSWPGQNATNQDFAQ
eukprot:1061238-Amphidinium_carterae.1